MWSDCRESLPEDRDLNSEVEKGNYQIVYSGIYRVFELMYS